MIAALATTLFMSLAVFTGIWLIHVKTKDAGMVDYYWAPGFAAISAAHAWFFGFNSASWLLFLLVCLWAFRLTSHLVDRHRRMTQEDARYAAMREAGGTTFWWKSLFSIFLLQGFLQWVIASPLHVVAQGPNNALSPLIQFFCFTLFSIGFLIETVADWQMRQFRLTATGENQLMQTGFWSLSRHPNYFGEMMIWASIGLYAYCASGSLFALIGPIILILAIRFVSIPLTEQHMKKTRATYLAYAVDKPMLLPFIRL